MHKRTARALLVFAAITTPAFGATTEPYDIARHYEGGSRVSFRGHDYRAKWWADAGQSPAEVEGAAHPWDTPWERADDDGGHVPPVLRLSSPRDGQRFAPHAVVELRADVSNRDGTVTGVEFFLDERSVGKVTQAPFALNAPIGETGMRMITAVAADETGATSRQSVTVRVGDIAGITIPLSELRATEDRLTDTPLMHTVKQSIRTLDNASVERVRAGRADNPANVRRVESIIDRVAFEYLFSLRAPEYTYDGLLQAFAKFPAACGDYSDGRDAEAICRTSLATMFAHFAQETGGHESWREVPEWRQGLVYVRELNQREGESGGYGECHPDTWQGQTWPCGKLADGRDVNYFGRGAKQLSYNYNYGPFSDAIFGDVRPLLDEPARVADTWLNFASAVFFFVYPQPPKPSMLHVIDGTWQPSKGDLANGLVPGFGVTTQIINGAVECGGPSEHEQSANRVSYYRNVSAHLEVPVGGDEVLGCKGMKQFDESSAAALPIFWENDWSWVADNPEGRSLACKLVSYQTPFSAFKPGDYALCVAGHNPDVEIVDDID